MDERPSGWEWPAYDRDGSSALGRSRLNGVVWPALFMFYLLQPVIDAFSHPHTVAFRILTVGLVLAYSAAYLGVMIRGTRTAPPRRVAWVAALFCMPVLIALLHGPGALVYWTYAIAAALVLLPRNVGVAIGFGSAGVMLLVTQLVDGAPSWDNAMLLVVMSMAMYGFTALHESVYRLREAQGKVAELAVERERSRLARDLHDVLGHSLTTITVKAGLARRVLESSADAELALAEVKDLERLSRQAMTEVRATVSGYRKASLAAELAGARAALRAAEITADLPHAVDNVPDSLQEPFAYVVREGVTNVIRHSGATRCEIRLGDSWIEVRDNGVGAVDAMNGAANGSGNGGGNGLTGLAERLSQVDGQLAAGPAPDGGFRVLAKVSAEAT